MRTTMEKIFIAAVLFGVVILGLSGCASGSSFGKGAEYNRAQVSSAMRFCHTLSDVYEMEACRVRFNAGVCSTDAECEAFTGEVY